MSNTMDAQTPSPQTTLVILLGASEWPDSPEFPGSRAFANAVTGFKSYLFDQKRFGLPNENALDLFDVDDSPHVIDRRMRQFLEHRMGEMKQAGNPANDLLVYFVGHGGFVGRNADYYLAVRCTSTENLRLSSIPMESLASTLTDKARYLRRIIILDCCYAAAAFTAFQAEGPARLGINQTFDAFEKKAKTVGRGTALHCSSGKTVASQIAQDESCTMFSKALIQVLSTGDERRKNQHYFSLRAVVDLTEEVIIRELEGKAPRPEIHSPDQKEGDVANIPFFPNLAVKKVLEAITYNNKGNVLFAARSYEETLVAYRQAIQLAPNVGLYYYNIGLTLMELKRFEEALVAYGQAIQLAPNEAAAHSGKGNAFYSLMRVDEALVAYEQAIQLSPNESLCHY